MSLPARLINISAEEYLASEAKHNLRHELVGGEMFAMAGASEAHNVIAGNLFAALRQHLRGTGCRAYIADMKARIEQTDDFYYPDVMATCEKFEAKSVFKTNPFLLIEVLSPSTISIDRREKLAAYRQIQALREYLVVYQDRKRIELHRKNSDSKWLTVILSESDSVVLESTPNSPLILTMNEIYEDVDFAQAEIEPDAI